MSRNKKPRKAYRPRQIAVNTLEVALWRAAKPARCDRAEMARAIESLKDNTP